MFEIDNDKLLSEMVALLREPDYYAEGYRQTAQFAKAMGVSTEVAFSRLERDGRFEKVIDKSHKAWWRTKV